MKIHSFTYFSTFLVSLLCLFAFTAPAALYKTDAGKIFFRSSAPLEVIEAESVKMKGLIDPEQRTFAFSVPINTFNGFNSPLQREHFNENYMESIRYPTASFKGKIIEQVDLRQPGEYNVRTKGILNIHGVEQERIIQSDVVVSGSTLRLKSSFTVPLADHNITIPRIVNQKIAEEIYVEVQAEMVTQ